MQAYVWHYAIMFIKAKQDYFNPGYTFFLLEPVVFELRLAALKFLPICSFICF